MTTHPRAYRYPGRVELGFPWRQHITPYMIATLKNVIPARARSYDPATKVWTVYHPWEEHAVYLLREAFPDATVVGADSYSYTGKEPPRRPEPRSVANVQHYTALHLLPTAPVEVVDAAYRALVKLHHPDRLPAGERDKATRVTQEINIAREALRGAGVV